jgi:pimeloyl-ACP methyl ester carboxylesterase
VIANNKAWRSAEQIRREWQSSALARKNPPNGALRYILTETRPALGTGHWAIRSARAASHRVVRGRLRQHSGHRARARWRDPRPTAGRAGHEVALAGKPNERNGRAAMAKGYSELRNELVTAANGVDYAYRDAGGEGEVPLVLLQHFRGNLDNWDPALIDALAPARRVVTFDNAGVGGSTGTTPDTIEQMARDAIAFLNAMQFSQVDLLGFSIGSFVAQQIALVRPAIVRRLVLASSAPQGAAGMHGWAPEVIGAIGTPNTSPEAYLDVFFARSASSRRAGQEALRRMYARTEDRDTATTWATREAQYDAVCAWGIPDHALLQRLAAIDMPVFVANGDSDPMILPRYSYLLAGLIPHARVKIYPDAAHGFLFQHHAEFAADVDAFLTRR